MKVFQIAAVEDNPTDRTWLSNKLEEYCKSRHVPYVLSCFSSGEAFLETLKTRRFHIVFMDIYLSGISGVEAAQTLRSEKPVKIRPDGKPGDGPASVCHP